MKLARKRLRSLTPNCVRLDQPRGVATFANCGRCYTPKRVEVASEIDHCGSSCEPISLLLIVQKDIKVSRCMEDANDQKFTF